MQPVILKDTTPTRAATTQICNNIDTLGRLQPPRLQRSPSDFYLKSGELGTGLCHQLTAQWKIQTQILSPVHSSSPSHKQNILH